MAHCGKQSSIAPLCHGALGGISDPVRRRDCIAAVPGLTPVITGKAGKAGRKMRILTAAQPQRQYQGSIFFADSMSGSNRPQRYRPFFPKTIDQRSQLTLLSKGFPIIMAFSDSPDTRRNTLFPPALRSTEDYEEVLPLSAIPWRSVLPRAAAVRPLSDIC